MTFLDGVGWGGVEGVLCIEKLKILYLGKSAWAALSVPALCPTLGLIPGQNWGGCKGSAYKV